MNFGFNEEELARFNSSTGENISRNPVLGMKKVYEICSSHSQFGDPEEWCERIYPSFHKGNAWLKTGLQTSLSLKSTDAVTLTDLIFFASEESGKQGAAAAVFDYSSGNYLSFRQLDEAFDYSKAWTISKRLDCHEIADAYKCSQNFWEFVGKIDFKPKTRIELFSLLYSLKKADPSILISMEHAKFNDACIEISHAEKLSSNSAVNGLFQRVMAVDEEELLPHLVYNIFPDYNRILGIRGDFHAFIQNMMLIAYVQSHSQMHKLMNLYKDEEVRKLSEGKPSKYENLAEAIDLAKEAPRFSQECVEAAESILEDFFARSIQEQTAYDASRKLREEHGSLYRKLAKRKAPGETAYMAFIRYLDTSLRNKMERIKTMSFVDERLIREILG